MFGGLSADGAHRLTFDVAPAREIRQRDIASRGGRAAAGAAGRSDEPFDMRLHVVDRDSSAVARAGDLVDVDAELARRAPDRGRSGRRRKLGFGGRRLCGSARAAADVDDFPRLVDSRLPLGAFDVLLQSAVARDFLRGVRAGSLSLLLRLSTFAA